MVEFSASKTIRGTQGKQALQITIKGQPLAFAAYNAAPCVSDTVALSI